MGSSPLTRGKRLATVRKGLWAGLIPAHAGKTATSCGHCLPTTAHPRSRGENHRMNTRRRRKLGSSPLTRGKLHGWAFRSRCFRLIPAHAGKTAPSCVAVNRCAAHPRSRGENRLPSDWDERRAGSSPLTRGKQVTILDRGHSLGLIPAHAGKTRRTTPSLSSPPAHPRSRGENLELRHDVGLEPGSSPLTRGKLGARSRDGHLGRLIPAHAGKTWSCRSRSACPSAHPRSRGENSAAFGWINGSLGSSPLTRGKLIHASDWIAPDRLIPAHAGKTHVMSRVTWRVTAHPRSRGENASKSTPIRSPYGSSPLTRGKRHHGDKGTRCRRLIPAHAGKTWQVQHHARQ